jgi:hypothetical protein
MSRCSADAHAVLTTRIHDADEDAGPPTEGVETMARAPDGQAAQAVQAGRGGRWRTAVWAFAAFLLLLPALAMQLTAEVNWDETDFIVWGTMLAIAAGTYELAARLSRNTAYRAAVGVAVVAGFVLVWINLAVGFIGNEDNPANLMYAGVLGIGAVGALLARFRPAGMARALVATAIAHASVGVIALVAVLDTRMVVLLMNAFFSVVWLLSAALFRAAAQAQPPADAAP